MNLSDSRRRWGTERPGMLQSMGSQRVRHDLATKQQHIPQKNFALTWNIHLQKEPHLPTPLLPEVPPYSSSRATREGPSWVRSSRLDCGVRTVCPPGSSSHMATGFQWDLEAQPSPRCFLPPRKDFSASDHFHFYLKQCVGKQSGNREGGSSMPDWGRGSQAVMGLAWGSETSPQVLALWVSLFVQWALKLCLSHALSPFLPCLWASCIHSYLMLYLIFKLALLQIRKLV